MKALRQYIRNVISESNFPLKGGEKLRIHHSRPGTRVEDDVQNSGSWPKDFGFSQSVGPKPEGLWYECQDGSSENWKDFCDAGLTGGSKKYDREYNVILNDYEILFIPDEHYFEKFYDMYSVNPPYDPDGLKGFDKMIDWPKVAKHYAGIEICPYLSSKRMDDKSFWYYGWDVASGCVWHAEGIKELQKKC
tara:strand:- start:836 stop:1408 length:573 start_codon:yes stop_codon:yes gene_type:complete